MTRRLMTSREAADYLAVSTDTLRRWARDGRLTRVYLSGRALRYYRDEIENLVADCAYRI